jgi:hypothetical protein
LLLPVPASANQNYGTKFERHYKRLGITAGTKSVSAEMLFKVYAGYMPTNSVELAAALRTVADQLGADVRKKHMNRMERITAEVLQIDPSPKWHTYKKTFADYPHWT